MEKQFLQFKIHKADNGEVTIVASDETLDRMGEVIPLDTWDLKNYKKNPVLLVDHDYKVSNIVGRAKNIKVDGKAMTFTPEFHGITQLAKEVEQMVLSDFAPAVSVGFMPKAPLKDGDKPSNELLEISFVSVPANPNALALAMKSVKDTEVKEIESWIKAAAPTALDLIKKIDPWVDSIEETITKISDALDAAGEPDDGDEEKAVINTEKKTVTISQELFDSMETEIKEGRVLSGKTRTKISECSNALKQAAALLDDLLDASSNDGKAGSEQKVEKTEVEHEVTAPKKAQSPVVRALQDINRISNNLLSEIKNPPQS